MANGLFLSTGEEGDDHAHPDDADMGDEPHEHEGEPAQDSIPAM